MIASILLHRSASVLLAFAAISLGAPLAAGQVAQTVAASAETTATRQTYAEQILFEERFENDLDAGWTWLREHASASCIRNQALEIHVEPGLADTVRNALLRKAPDRSQGTYAIEVTLTSLAEPIQQYEQAGITWYNNGKPVFKLVKELVNGETFIVPGVKPMTSQTVQLRLVVTADSWTAQYRPDAQGEFLTAASGQLPPPGDDQVSIQCYNGPAESEHWFRFDDFRILRLAD